MDLLEGVDLEELEAQMSAQQEAAADEMSVGTLASEAQPRPKIVAKPAPPPPNTPRQGAVAPVAPPTKSGSSPSPPQPAAPAVGFVALATSKSSSRSSFSFASLFLAVSVLSLGCR